MRISAKHALLCNVPSLFILILLLLGVTPALSQDYDALEGVKGLNTVFDYGHASPEAALTIFPAIREVYQSKSVTSLPTPPSVVIVFHDAAVKFLTTERNGSSEENATRDKIAEAIRQFEKDGVKMEVCMYAVKVFGVNPDTIMPEIEKVGNGWIAASGYQAKGYSLIAVP
jgi:intracellular sulfur oxidation DsrE/DsrF family protein